MAPAGQEFEARLRLVASLALRQDAETDSDHRVGRKGEAGGEIRPFACDHRRGEGLFPGQPFGEPARLFAPTRRFIDLGRQDCIGLDADLRKKREPPRRSGP
jgi:hypothetical protein